MKPDFMGSLLKILSVVWGYCKEELKLLMLAIPKGTCLRGPG